MDVTLHLYCHGLGDCILLELPRRKGAPFRMLIDCGIHTSSKGGTGKIREVVEDIAKVADRRLDVVIGTHEHWDHISGFSQARDLFAEFEIGEIWFSWAENPEDPQARELDKFKGEADQALAEAALRLEAAAGSGGDPDRYGMLADGVDALLGFVFGLKGERSRGAREALRALGKEVRYFEPGERAPLPEDVGDDFKIYVLAPPRDEEMLRIKDRLSETYAAGAAASPTAAVLMNGMAVGEGRLAVDDDPASPFAREAGEPLSELLAGKAAEKNQDRAARRARKENIGFLSAHYAGPAQFLEKRKKRDRDVPGEDQSWRRIDQDWLGAAAELALQLDSKTNNTSFVFALEIVASGRTLIFAADAQVGSWKSWAGVEFRNAGGEVEKTGADLLRRAIFYKVGHHASRNATLKQGGLELMTDADLTAFVPTDEEMAEKVRWHDIPADGLLARLHEKTGGRVIRSDRIQEEASAAEIASGGSLRSISVALGLKVVVEIG